MSAENETTELKLPYPSATGAIKNGAQNIQELAERVDLLLREQLTKAVKIAKLTVTEAITLPSESITEAMLKALAVTTAKLAKEAVTSEKIGSQAITDTKVGNERQLLTTTNAYSERTNIEGGEAKGSGTSVTFTNPSSTKMCHVVFDFEIIPESGFGTSANIYAGGVKVQEFFAGEHGSAYRAGSSVLLNPSAALKIEHIGGGSTRLAGIAQSHRLL